jgi:hypothetical protein
VDRYSTSPFALILTHQSQPILTLWPRTKLPLPLPHRPQPILTFRLGSSDLYISPINDDSSTPRRLGPSHIHLFRTTDYRLPTPCRLASPHFFCYRQSTLTLPSRTKLPHIPPVNNNPPSPCRLGSSLPLSVFRLVPLPLLPLSFPYLQATQSVLLDSLLNFKLLILILKTF